MPVKTIKIFLASSLELKDDREGFRSFISKQNDRLHKQGIYLEIVQWENFLDAISRDSLQEEYNAAIRHCHIVVCLFWTKVGIYTNQEFNTAYEVFKDTGLPKIWTYFNNTPVKAGTLTEEITTLFAFKNKLKNLGHFYSEYQNIDNLFNQFRDRLDEILPVLIEQVITPQSTVLNTLFPISTSPKNTFNEKLTRGLIETMATKIPRVRKFLDNANIVAPDWEKKEKVSDPAKELIAVNFVGVLGIQLRKLIAIGKEDSSANKQKKYIENCQLTGKRALQLLCFTLFSKLWDVKKERAFELTPTQAAICNSFFDNEFEWEMNNHVDLLKTLIEIFTDNDIEFPIDGFHELAEQLQSGSAFMEALVKLQAVNNLPENASFTIEHCSEAEINLTTILTKLNFLIGYKMISIKNISYSEMRNTKPHYLYNYTDLTGIDSSAGKTQGQEKMRYEEVPINTDAVLLYKESYRQNLNLFPFIIDINALSVAGGQKICFYTAKANADSSLNYSFIEDNTVVNIKNSKTLKPGVDINELLTDPAKLTDIRYDAVYNLFSEAKKIITGIDNIEE